MKNNSTWYMTVCNIKLKNLEISKTVFATLANATVSTEKVIM